MTNENKLFRQIVEQETEKIQTHKKSEELKIIDDFINGFNCSYNRNFILKKSEVSYASRRINIKISLVECNKEKENEKENAKISKEILHISIDTNKQVPIVIYNLMDIHCQHTYSASNNECFQNYLIQILKNDISYLIDALE